ncbi:hypothetical protein Tco_1104360 [Tanacetum coccineum]
MECVGPRSLGLFVTNGCGDRCLLAAKRSNRVSIWFMSFYNVNDINQLVSNLRTAWMGGFHLFADVAKYGRTYNRPGDGKPSVGSNSQSVSINENVFLSFNSVAKRVSDCKQGIKEAGNEAVKSISVAIVLIWMICWGKLGLVGIRLYGQWTGDNDFKCVKEIFLEFKDVFSRFYSPDVDVFGLTLVGLPFGIMGSRGFSKLGGLVMVGKRACLPDWMLEMNLEDDACEILELLLGDCGMVTNDENEGLLRQLLLLKKTTSIAPPSTPRSPMEIYRVVRSGNSFVEDYFPYDLRFGVFYDNVKKLFFHSINALIETNKG